MPQKYSRGQKRVLKQLQADERGERLLPYWPVSHNMMRALQALERKGAIRVNYRTRRVWLDDPDWK